MNIARILLAFAILPIASEASLSSAVPQEVSLDAVRAKLVLARDDYLDALEDFAEWCGSNKLFGERNRAYEAILLQRPNHSAAHRALGHELQRDGSWKAPERAKKAKNFKPSLLGEAEERLLSVGESYRDAVLPLLKKHEALLDRKERASVCEALLRILPDDADLRALLGEVHDGKVWVLEESLRARKHRKVLSQGIQNTMKDVAPSEPTALTIGEKALEIDFPVHVGNSIVRVVGTVEEAEAKAAARLGWGAESLFRMAFEYGGKLPRGYTIYLVPDEPAREQFKERHPLLQKRTKRELDRFWGLGMGRKDMVRWDPDRGVRLDGATRHGYSLYLGEVFGIDTQQGWAFEGVGLYPTRLLTGTRSRWYVEKEKGTRAGGKASIDSMPEKEVNWMAKAHEFLTGVRPPDLGELMEKPINGLGVNELILAYAMSAYFLEGHHEKLPRFLAAIGKRKVKPVPALLEVFDMDPFQLRERLVRWLEERK